MGLWSDFNSVYLSNRIWTVLKITFSIIAHCQALRMPVELQLQFIAYGTEYVRAENVAVITVLGCSHKTQVRRLWINMIIWL